jgi:hypothetical protein
MPLVIAGGQVEEHPVSEARERARKIEPEYARGELVRVAGGRNQAEAQLIQNLLLEEGIPSLLRRSVGSDVPEMLAAGDRDVLVPESGAQAARDVLLAAELLPSASAAAIERPNPIKLLAVVLGGGAFTALIAWALLELSA